eukprot:13036609-Ditylum_brightwellii.AAC.1
MIQRQVALGTYKADYITLSTTLRDSILIMQLMEAMKEQDINIGSFNPKVHCKSFEDSAGALELVMAPKMFPLTKHIKIQSIIILDHG